jgi:hypothetical protein
MCGMVETVLYMKTLNADSLTIFIQLLSKGFSFLLKYSLKSAKFSFYFTQNNNGKRMPQNGYNTRTFLDFKGVIFWVVTPSEENIASIFSVE